MLHANSCFFMIAAMTIFRSSELCSMTIYVSLRIQLSQYFAFLYYAPWQFTFLQEFSYRNTSLSWIMLHDNLCFFKNSAIAILRFPELCSMTIYVSLRIQLSQYFAFLNYAPWQFTFLQEFSYRNISLFWIMLRDNLCFFKNSAIAIFRSSELCSTTIYVSSEFSYCNISLSLIMLHDNLCFFKNSAIAIFHFP
jgi:hypothetical protein